MAADDLALLAHRLHRRSYLHGPFRRVWSSGAALAAVEAAATTPRSARMRTGRSTRDENYSECTLVGRCWRVNAHRACRSAGSCGVGWVIDSQRGGPHGQVHDAAVHPAGAFAGGGGGRVAEVGGVHPGAARRRRVRLRRALQGNETATQLRVRDGETQLTDGPFIEAKEYLGRLLRASTAPDLDAALAWAAKVPKRRATAPSRCARCMRRSAAAGHGVNAVERAFRERAAPRSSRR